MERKKSKAWAKFKIFVELGYFILLILYGIACLAFLLLTTVLPQDILHKAGPIVLISFLCLIAPLLIAAIVFMVRNARKKWRAVSVS
jgi:hypothetical protein